jgi:hypothetical protein
MDEEDCNCGWGGQHDPDNPRCLLNRITVHLIRRTLPEQVEYLITQVAILVARVGTLEREVETLRARLVAVERATPWTAPPKPKPPKLPPRR